MSSPEIKSSPLEVVTGSSLPRPKFLQTLQKNSFSDRSFNENKSEVLPIFKKKQLNFQSSKKDASYFTHLTVSKNWLVCIVVSPNSSVTLIRHFLPRNQTTAGKLEIDFFNLNFYLAI